MGTQTAKEAEFNSLQFEKKLTSLKDSQDSINAACQWCLQNRQHHKKIVNAWLNVLKRVKVEQRLILFYLANDVVQYSKRRNYEYVESWGTALQKATTLVRDDKVKHKILRIFKIWEQRGVYNEEFISDLCGLISVVPSAPKGDEPHEFQPNYVINKIKTCSNLETDTDTKLKLLKEHNPKIQIETELCASLKDRAHVDDVEKEIEVYVTHMEDYINALKLEIKNRIALISVLKQAETQLESDRKDVKLVAHAYKMFGTRVKTFQKKLEEHKSTLSSPVPSPDINAPSPSPDSDIDEAEAGAILSLTTSASIPAYNPSIEFTNAGYYNPVPPPATKPDDSFLANGFSTFMGSNMPFNLQNLGGSSLFGSSTNTTQSTGNQPSSGQPPLPVEAPNVAITSGSKYQYSPSGHLQPLLPPPMPPFNSKTDVYGNTTYNAAASQYESKNVSTSAPTKATYTTSSTNCNSTFISESFEPPAGSNPYPPISEEYNPEQDVDTWEPDGSWGQLPGDLDTPESPPLFEKESYTEPVEYHDNARSGAVDVDHRVLPGLSSDICDDSLSSLGGKDVDHRNLISLTGSPADSNSNLPPGDLWSQSDMDYRTGQIAPAAEDQDYRPPFNIENLKLPPPPPPPPSKASIKNSNSDKKQNDPSPHTSKSPRKFQDNVESIDMDLSDDESVDRGSSKARKQFSLEPPPPLPDLPEDDVDANTFLDDLNNDLNEFSNLSDEVSNQWEQPPPVNFNNVNTNLPPPPPMMTMPPNPNWMPEGPPPNNWTPEFENAPPDWIPEQDGNDWVPEYQDNWEQQSNSNNFNFRGRGQFRGDFNNVFNNKKILPRGRGRGAFNFRGGNNNFRGRGAPRGHRGGRHQKGNFRGNFRGGF